MTTQSPNALLGRQHECEVLDRVVEDAKGARSRVLVLRSEAGIGKSSLLEYLGEKATACRVEHSVGIESEMDLAFSGLHQTCASMLDKVDRLPQPQRAALHTVFGLESGPPPDQFLIGLSVLGLLA